MANRAELTSKTYSLKCRLRLFESIVTPTVLYGASSWTLSAASQNKLQVTQRRMLRMLFGIGRKRTRQPAEPESECTTSSSSSTADSGTGQTLVSDTVENWVDWIKRATEIVDNHLDKLHIENWCVAWRRKVWRYAARVASMPAERWALKSVLWPAADDPRARGRRQHRPKKRWADDIVLFLKDAGHNVDATSWVDTAKDSDFWEGLEQGFCDHAGY